MTEIEEYTMIFFKKAAFFKTVSTLSKIILLITLPIFIMLFKQMTDIMAAIGCIGLVCMFLVWILSTRKYNFINTQIQMNLWLSDMISNPGKFSSFLHKNDIK